jgi:hypothetical protein
MGERGGLLGLFLSFILFFSIPASWRANEMGVPALPCPFPLFPLISSCFGFCCKKKVKTQRIHIKCVKARSLSACIASLKTDTNLFDGSNVGCFFFFFLGLAPRNFQGGTGRASLRRLRRPAFPHRYCTRTLLFGVGIVQKHSFALTRQAQPSKHRAPVKRHTVVLPPPPPLHLVHKRPSRLGDSKSFPESSSYHTYRMPYSHYHMPALGSLSGAFHHCGSTNHGLPCVCQ